METGGSLRAPDSVRKLQTALHAKAKGSPDFRFYSLSDKVWRADVLEAAWQTVRRNGGAAGVDGETVQRIEAQGVERWLGELARDLKEGSYRPGAVRQVLIPPRSRQGSTERWAYRAFGIGLRRRRRWWVLAPIFEADLEPEQYAYREGCSAQDAVQRVHRLLNRGHREVVDADLSNYFGRDSTRRTDAQRGPPRERRATAGLDQGVVGDAGWKRTTARVANAARTKRDGRGRGRRKARRSHRCSATSTCDAS